MIPVTSQFQSALRRSHTLAVKCQILRNGEVYWEGEITDGNITYAADNKILRTCKLTINDVDLVPAVETDLLAPVGTEIKLWRGLEYPDGTQELVPQGVFVLDQDGCRVIDSGQGLQLQIQASDRASKIAQDQLPYDYAILGSGWQDVGNALKKFLYTFAPWVEYGTDFTTFTNEGIATILAQAGKNPWDIAYKMMADAGYRLYFDESGLLTAKEVYQDYETGAESVWDFVEGEENTTLYTDKVITSEQTYNRMVVVGQPTTGSAVIGIAVDDDPTSVTYINGDFGIKTKRYASPLIYKTSQAQRVAQNMLSRLLGLQEHVHIQAVPMPALEVDDTVQLTRAASRIDALYRINKITMPLVHDRGMDIMMSPRRIGGISVS